MAMLIIGKIDSSTAVDEDKMCLLIGYPDYLPHIDGVGLFFQSNSREGNVSLNLVEERDVLMSKIIIFCRLGLRHE